MAKSRAVLAVVVLVCGAGLCGCGKEVKVTFVNLTSEELDLYFTSPGGGREYLGVIRPMGEFEHEAEFGKENLPATCTWSAGPYGDRFVVGKDTERDMQIDIAPGGGL